MKEVKNIFKKSILYQILYLGLFISLLIFLIFYWLKFYTNHGQKVKLDNLIGKDLNKAQSLISKNNFQLVVIDSVFILGKNGGIILEQNPKPNAEVKNNRKVYVVISKFDPDKIRVSELPILYGNDYTQKAIELKHRGILTSIKAKKYDPGDENHIIEVYYNNELIIDKNIIKNNIQINKGGNLEFVISDKSAGDSEIPNLTCKTVSEADFILQQLNLQIGDLNSKGTIKDTMESYIIDQDPKFIEGAKIPMNSKVNLTIVNFRPSRCLK